MPYIIPPGAPSITARLLNQRFLTRDGNLLPVKTWLPDHPQAAIVALHGFNDYSNFIRQPAEFFRQHHIACYAYDQRGFGGTPSRGFWSGTAAYTQDLLDFVRLVRQQHPSLPVFVLGESMGGAVTVSAAQRLGQAGVDGLILVAPAIWGRATMPWYQPPLLASLVHTVPWLRVTGRGLKIRASDNIEALKALAADPMVIKATRIDAMSGLTDLMDEALNNAREISLPTLLLYGQRDQIIPKAAMKTFVEDFVATNPANKTVIFYPQGFHLLLRDLNGQRVWQDTVAWIASSSRQLPNPTDRP